MKFIYMILMPLLLCLLAINTNADNTSNGTFLNINGLKKYGLLIKEKDNDSKKDDNEIEKYYVVDIKDSEKHIILDSIATRIVFAGDTNTIIYELTDNKKSYLVSFRLSPEIKRDTLIEITYNEPNNWIKDSDSFVCSIKDSILSYKLTKQNDITILKILPDNDWKTIKKLAKPLTQTISNDFTQILICTQDLHSLEKLIPSDLGIIGDVNIDDSLISDFGKKETEYPLGSILIYDILLDSIYTVDNAGTSNTFALRLHRNSPIYYTKNTDNIDNLYTCSERNLEKRLTNCEYPYYVCDILFMGDDIVATIFNYEDLTDFDTQFFEIVK